MKKENTKSPKNKAIQQEEDLWIDVHNDNVMREMGFLRPFNQAPRDESVWTKTPNERRLLRIAKNACKKEDMHFYTVPRKFIPLQGKLIIYLRKNKVYPKTTYSMKCWQSDIQDILSKYTVKNHKLNITESAVDKYTWNGKTYYPGKLPFWGK